MYSVSVGGHGQQAGAGAGDVVPGKEPWHAAGTICGQDGQVPGPFQATLALATASRISNEVQQHGTTRRQRESEYPLPQLKDKRGETI